MGKTTLANALLEVLSGAVIIKIGHGNRKAGKNENLYPPETGWEQVLREHPAAPFLLVESNAILSRMSPDLLIFLDGPGAKPSAAGLPARADIVSGRRMEPDNLARLAERIGIGNDAMTRIAWLAGSRPEPAAAIILAGGKSLRMGTDKARLEIAGMTLVERLHAQLKPQFDEVLISVACTGDELVPGVRHVVDQKPTMGPLMAIHSALSASSCPVNYVTACDVPEISVGLVRKLLSCLVSATAAVARSGDGMLQPLTAAYRREALGHTEVLLSDGKRRVRDLLARCRAEQVTFAGDDWCVNLNDPGEYRKYLARSAKEKGCK